jgi:c-di-AMP phosphodiesterase-like protein
MGRTYISARSLGEINVQVIMEQFGGGGHLNTAGAQLRMSPEEAIEQIKEYLAKEGLE